MPTVTTKGTDVTTEQTVSAIGRLVNELGIARKVADAIKSAPGLGAT
jgi:hypothetical protein